MLKYLIVQLDDTSVSFCHYINTKKGRRLIPLSDLKSALFWSMKENLNVQFLYPDYELPIDYVKVINSVDHSDIVADTCEDVSLKADADVVVFSSLKSLSDGNLTQEQVAIAHISFEDFLEHLHAVTKALSSISRLNIIFTDVEKFTDDYIVKYEEALKILSRVILDEYKKGHQVQCNLLTDRIMLDKMNNCNAGEEHITLSPDGNYYICPAFYFNEETKPNGDVRIGPRINNSQLYKISYSPICRECDANHCKRCVWLNRLLTSEVNTPSRQQCVMAHVERNAARELLKTFRNYGLFMSDIEIPEIYYIDPFDKITKK